MAKDASPSILVVDDYREMASLLRKVLHNLGYPNVDEVTDGARALQMMREKKFDAVIVDWNMKPVSGIELLREVRADKDLASLPFIMISGISSQQRVEEARDERVTHYIAKPFSANTLRRSLEAALGEV